MAKPWAVQARPSPTTGMQSTEDEREQRGQTGFSASSIISKLAFDGHG